MNAQSMQPKFFTALAANVSSRFEDTVFNSRIVKATVNAAYWILGIFLVFSSTSMVTAAPSPKSIKLFDAVPLTTSSASPYVFGTKNMNLTLNVGQTAIISSTPDGAGSFISDNNLRINGTKICGSSCYGSTRVGPYVLGSPVDTYHSKIAAMDVSGLISTGTTTVTFELYDEGGSYGSTELWLVIDGGTSAAVSSVADPDGDGISGSRDNCPYDYNPDQEDGWGSEMGDPCDTDWYNRTGVGVAGFVQKDGIYHLHGNCIYLADGAPRCPVIAAFDPTAFDPANMPLEISSGDAGTWTVWLHYLYGANGVDVYQVNTYSTNPSQPDTQVDDLLEIHVIGSNWQWYHRGGDTNYHGI
jgi:hypothetical protein